uniref:Metalloendopeptidase n=1 Tax=Panagrolaimus sp. PS1159 TaxID=55785 RepID=A0AC35FA70_9BILA
MTKFYNVFILLLFLPKLLLTTKVDPDLISFNAKLWSKLLSDQILEAEYDDINTDDDIRKRKKVEFSNGIDSNFDGEESIPWPNAEIPYTIDNIKFDQTFLMEFYSALKEFHTKTCVKFRPKRSSDRYFIKIIKDEGCWSYVGLQPELIDIGQEVSLGDECWKKGIIIHEFTHVLGFFHEHSRFDRDLYINLNHQNIQKSKNLKD